MPKFESFKCVTKFDTRLSKQELIWALKICLAAEHEAHMQYMQICDACEDDLARKVLRSIADEELVHAGEFSSLIEKLYPECKAYYKEGAAEVAKLEAGTKKEDKDSLEDSSPDDIKKKRLDNLFKI